jgi:hypothetical protein
VEVVVVVVVVVVVAAAVVLVDVIDHEGKILKHIYFMY